MTGGPRRAEAGFALIHLSDLHIHPDPDPLLVLYLQGIAASLRSLDTDISTCFVAVTGDVAWTGRGLEYKAAAEFLNALRSHLSSLPGAPAVEFIIVPGNHDCCFDTEPELRRDLLARLEDGERDLAGDELSCLVRVQEDFARFAAPFVGKAPSDLMTLFYRREVNIGEFRVCFDCYNTAWMSRKEETTGKLAFPLDLVDWRETDAELVVSVLHHPFSWLCPGDARALRAELNQRSDIILTGHEHAPSFHAQRWDSGETPTYVEGGVLHNRNSSESSFNIISIEGGSGEFFIRKLRWSPKEGVYRPEQTALPLVFNRARRGLASAFTPANKFDEYLDDPGSLLNHPLKENLRLADCYVFPELAELGLTSGSPSVAFSVVGSDSVLEFILRRKRVVVYGPGQCGKTSLLKILFRRLLLEGYVPVIVEGGEIKTGQREDLSKRVRKEFEKQYSADMVERFMQLPSSQKCLLIDNWDETRLKSAVRQKLLGHAAQMFNYLIVTCDEAVSTEEYATGQLSYDAPDLTQCEMQRFGRRLRAKLIEKWVSLGREETLDNDELAYLVTDAERLVDEVLGSNFVPAFPIVILTILQTRDSQLLARVGAGSLCYYYQALINLALVACSRGIPDVEADDLNSLLAELAYRILLCRRRRAFLTSGEAEELFRDFTEKYALRIDVARAVSALHASRVLRYEDGELAFRYRYLFYYYAGYYLSRNLRVCVDEKRIQDLIHQMARQLHLEGNASVLLFLVYHSADPLVTDEILSAARSVLSDVAPSTLTDDVAVCGSWLTEPLEASVGDREPREERELRRARLDERERCSPPPKDEELLTEESGGGEGNDLKAGYYCMRVLGQMLRHFPGALRAEDKLRTTTEAFALALRLVKAALRSLERVEGVLHRAPEPIRVRDGEAKIVLTPRHLGWVSLVFGHIILREAAMMIGSGRLTMTYEQLLQQNPSIGYRVLVAAIELEHFRHPDYERIAELHSTVSRYPWTRALVRLLVIYRLKYLPPARGVRQRVCSRLGITDSSLYRLPDPDRD